MPTIFRLDASIRAQGSVTRSIADSLEATLTASLRDLSIVNRDVGLNPLPSTAWAGAVFAPYTPVEQRSPQQQEALALAAELAREMTNADAYIFAVPLYNFGVSQHFKTWIDIVLTQPGFASGTEAIIKGRPAQLVVARGGGYGPGTPRHGWDHGTAWYKRILEDIWMLDVQLIECELTLADVTPAMEGLRGLAAENLLKAHSLARDNGKHLALGFTS